MVNTIGKHRNIGFAYVTKTNKHSGYSMLNLRYVARFRFSLFSLILLCIVTTSIHAQVLDRVVAIVNDDIITLSELEEEGKEFLAQVRQSNDGNDVEENLAQAREQVLSNLINQRLINQEAVKANVGLTEQDLEQNYAANLSKMGTSREEFVQQLEKSGIREDKYKESLRNKLLRDKLIHYEVRSKIIVTEEMTSQYYQNEYTSEIADGGYYILQMGFTWKEKADLESDQAKASALKRAEAARDLILSGADFGNIAREKSELPSAADGGDLGVFQEDEMADTMKNAILPLQVGETSEIIETAESYQFFKLLSTQKGDIIQQVPYESVKEEIRKKLFEKKFSKEYTEWVLKIKDGAYIKKML